MGPAGPTTRRAVDGALDAFGDQFLHLLGRESRRLGLDVDLRGNEFREHVQRHAHDAPAPQQQGQYGQRRDAAEMTYTEGYQPPHDLLRFRAGIGLARQEQAGRRGYDRIAGLDPVLDEISVGHRLTDIKRCAREDAGLPLDKAPVLAVNDDEGGGWDDYAGFGMLGIVAGRPYQHPLAFSHIRVLKHREETASRYTGVEGSIPDWSRRPSLADGRRIEAGGAQAVRSGSSHYAQRKSDSQQFGAALGECGEEPAFGVARPGRPVGGPRRQPGLRE